MTRLRPRGSFCNRRRPLCCGLPPLTPLLVARQSQNCLCPKPWAPKPVAAEPPPAESSESPRATNCCLKSDGPLLEAQEGGLGDPHECHPFFHRITKGRLAVLRLLAFPGLFRRRRRWGGKRKTGAVTSPTGRGRIVARPRERTTTTASSLAVSSEERGPARHADRNPSTPSPEASAGQCLGACDSTGGPGPQEACVERPALVAVRTHTSRRASHRWEGVTIPARRNCASSRKTHPCALAYAPRSTVPFLGRAHLVRLRSRPVPPRSSLAPAA